MRHLINVAALATLLMGLAGCGGVETDPGTETITHFVDGAAFEIADAAVYSNCVSVTFSVRGFRPPPGADPQVYFPPTKKVVLQVTSHGRELSARPLGGGGGGGGDEEDGRIWISQEGLYSLEEAVAEGEEVKLEATITLDDDFGVAEPLRFQIPLIAGPGGGTCP